MKKHQALIKDSSLPQALERLAQERAIRTVLEGEGGYAAVGLDHYALPTDEMAIAARAQALHRNFQGYTTDAAPVLIGIGASSIGALPQGYVQNETGVPAYSAAIERGDFAVARGVALTPDDKLRRAVIEAVMCDLAVDLPRMAKSMDMSAAPLLDDAAGLTPFIEDGLVTWDGARLSVTDRGRPFVRNVAALFDVYLRRASATPRHAASV